MQAQGGKLSGVLGTLIGHLMNIFHGNIHAKGLHNIPIHENANAYKDMLSAAGFQDIALDTITNSGGIKVVARA
jgi:hypothetical protein